jgi:DNA-binding MurR/RpiR family transcriptional regulator
MTNTKNLQSRVLTLKQQISDMNDQWTDRQVQADQVFLKATQAEVRLTNLLDKNEDVLQKLLKIEQDYEDIKETMAQLQKASSIIIFGLKEDANPACDCRNALKPLQWVIPKYTRFYRKGQYDTGKPCPLVVRGL